MSCNYKENNAYIKRDICITNNLDVIKILVEEGLDINEYGICGHTPLHFHIKEGNFEIVKYLLSKNADINKKNIYGENIMDDILKYNDNHQIYEYILNEIKYKKIVSLQIQ